MKTCNWIPIITKIWVAIINMILLNLHNDLYCMYWTYITDEKLKFRKTRKNKEKSEQPRSHTKEVALYQLKSSSIRNLKPDLYFFSSQDGLYSISMQKIITKKLMNKRYCIGINWHSLKFEANTFLLYYIFMPVLFTFKIYRVKKLEKHLK